MKKIILSIVAICALVLLPMSVFAADAETVTEGSSAKVKIIEVITATNEEADYLDFGTLVIGNISAGVNTATISAIADAQTASTAGNVSTITDGKAAIFTVTGTDGAAFTVTINGGTDLTITNVGTVEFDDSGERTIDVGGERTLYVGGTLTLSTTAVASNTQYSENFDVVFDYN